MATNNSINQSEALAVPVTVAKGGTGLTTLTDKSLLVGAGTNTVGFVAPGSSGNQLTSDGTSWTSAAPGGGNPVGDIMLWSTTTAPTGWILCDGASLARAGTYSALFAIIGTTYGSADGDHFNVPSVKGKVAVGYKSDDTDFDAMGHTGGAKTHTVALTELPSHTHTFRDGGGNAASGSFRGMQNPGATGDSSSVGGGGAHNNLQPFLTLNYIIKY